MQGGGGLFFVMQVLPHPPNPEANLTSISHRCHPILVAFVWELTEEAINLPLGCLQGGSSPSPAFLLGAESRSLNACLA